MGGGGSWLEAATTFEFHDIPDLTLYRHPNDGFNTSNSKLETAK